MNILVTIPMDEEQKKTLSAIAPDARVDYIPADQVTQDEAAQAEIIC